MADIRLGKVYQLYDLVVGTFWLLKGGLKVCPSEQLSNIHDFFDGPVLNLEELEIYRIKYLCQVTAKPGRLDLLIRKISDLRKR